MLDLWNSRIRIEIFDHLAATLRNFGSEFIFLKLTQISRHTGQRFIFGIDKIFLLLCYQLLKISHLEVTYPSQERIANTILGA
jgi:hypothetical protein